MFLLALYYMWNPCAHVTLWHVPHARTQAGLLLIEILAHLSLPLHHIVCVLQPGIAVSGKKLNFAPRLIMLTYTSIPTHHRKVYSPPHPHGLKTLAGYPQPVPVKKRKTSKSPWFSFLPARIWIKCIRLINNLPQKSVHVSHFIVCAISIGVLFCVLFRPLGKWSRFRALGWSQIHDLWIRIRFVSRNHSLLPVQVCSDQILDKHFDMFMTQDCWLLCNLCLFDTRGKQENNWRLSPLLHKQLALKWLQDSC